MLEGFNIPEVLVWVLPKLELETKTLIHVVYLRRWYEGERVVKEGRKKAIKGSLIMLVVTVRHRVSISLGILRTQ